MKTYEYIRDIRSRTSDSPVPVTISPRLSDSILITTINNARKTLTKEFKCFDNQCYIFPALHQDEYSIPTNLLEITGVYDIKKQQEFIPLNKMNAESTKNVLFGNEAYLYNNLFYLNENRKVITFKNIPTVAEPVYTISAWSRANKTVTVSASTGTLSAILGWNTTKSFVKVYDTSTPVNTEYLRISDIVDNGNSTYTLYVASYNTTKEYINNTAIYGTVTMASASTTITGSGTKFTTDLDVGMNIYYNGTLKGTVSATASDTSFTLSATAGTTVAGAIIYGDTLKDYTGKSLQFATYLINYKSEPIDMTMYNEDDILPAHIQDLVPILASEEAWRRRSRLDMASQEMQMYEQKKLKIVSAFNSANAKQYNKSLR